MPCVVRMYAISGIQYAYVRMIECAAMAKEIMTMCCCCCCSGYCC
jgi:hypothetical protein